MDVLMFDWKFVAPILCQRKLLTIRMVGARKYRIGQDYSGRFWDGTPYRLGVRQKEFAVLRICSLSAVRISAAGIHVNGERCRPQRRCAIARMDGFRSWPMMRAWFKSNYALPVNGVMIIFRVVGIPHT